MGTRRQTSIGIPVALSLGLVLSACGAGSTRLESGAPSSSVPSTEVSAESPTTGSTPAQTEITASTAAAQETTLPGVNNYPDATVLAVDSGEPFNLRMLADSGTPVAMWFYYPH
jgi:hypothetical protein